MKTVVYANTIDWNFEGLTQRPHHIMKGLSERGYKVYFINFTKRKDKVRDRISENFEVYHNWEVFKKRVPRCDIYFSSWARRYTDLDEIECDMVIYDSLDNFPEHEKYEEDMIKRSDVVLAASEPLYKLRKKQHDNVHLCKNACFIEHGNKKYEIPRDLIPFKKLNKPIILFAGALSGTWCDISLVERVAKKFTLVMVGKPWFLDKIPKGVHYLGPKTHDELQAYYAHCDVSILPFSQNQISYYSSPIKLWEAMAHGKPSVATDIPEARAYSDVILVSKNHHEFLKNINKAIELSKKSFFIKKAKAIAAQNTWNHRVDLIDSLIKEYFNKAGER